MSYPTFVDIIKVFIL